MTKKNNGNNNNNGDSNANGNGNNNGNGIGNRNDNGNGNISKEKESVIPFPCDFMIKVMGQHNDHFEKKVLNIVRRHIPDAHQKKVTKRLSRNNNYLSITIIIYAESKQQLDTLYKDLTSAPEVIMAL